MKRYQIVLRGLSWVKCFEVLDKTWTWHISKNGHVLVLCTIVKCFRLLGGSLAGVLVTNCFIGVKKKKKKKFVKIELSLAWFFNKIWFLLDGFRHKLEKINYHYQFTSEFSLRIG